MFLRKRGPAFQSGIFCRSKLAIRLNAAVSAAEKRPGIRTAGFPAWKSHRTIVQRVFRNGKVAVRLNEALLPRGEAVLAAAHQPLQAGSKTIEKPARVASEAEKFPKGWFGSGHGRIDRNCDEVPTVTYRTVYDATGLCITRNPPEGIASCLAFFPAHPNLKPARHD